MKKIIFLVILTLFSILLLAQNQDRDLKRVNFPQAFVQAGKEYPAGNYWVVLTMKDGLPLFTVHNAQKELLFEELAVVKPRSGGRTGSAFRVKKGFVTDKEYFRIMVTTPGQWLMGYFLVKK